MRNTLAGSKQGTSKSARYYQGNKVARDKKNRYNKKYHSSKNRILYRAALNKKNVEDGTYGNKDGIDKSHTKSGRLVNENQSSNRARNRGKK